MQLESSYCGILKGSSEWQADKCLHIIQSKMTSHCSAESNNYNYSFIQNVQHVSRKNTKSFPQCSNELLSTEEQILK